MSRPFVPVRYLLCTLVCGVFFLGASTVPVHAVLPTVDARVIADSAETFDRRIYSYDMQIDPSGSVHIVYSQPYTDRKARVYYVRRVNGVWQSPKLLTEDGYRDNKSTFVVIGKNNHVHVCYIKDESGSEALYYRLIYSSGTVGPEVYVESGGWWSRMQLDDNNYPMFVRGSADWDEPAKPSRLSLLTTTDGANWDRALLPLHDVNQFRLADFIYADGTYHVTYGDSEYTKMVYNNKNSSVRTPETFHNLYYATSSDGLVWTEHLVDSSGTLYDREFWTSMVLLGGNPLVAMFRYNEYGDSYCRGTSVKLYEWTGSSWTSKIITNQIYPDTNEGMGVGLAVNGAGDYFGAWDFSPDYPQILPGSPKGNTAMRRSGPNNDWSPVAQLDPFSLEGRVRLRIHDGSLYYLALADYTDSKLYFREFSIFELSKILPSPEGLAPSGSNCRSLPAVYHMLLDKAP